MKTMFEFDDEIDRVLVTGGAGYIGSALLPKLLDRGYIVRVLDLFMFGDKSIAHLFDHPRLEIIKGDFRHVGTVVKAMENVDAVIHLGAIVGDPACALYEDLTIEVNLMGTRLLAEVAQTVGVRRFMFASTCSVYGASDGILDEGSELNPVSLYACSKISAEQVVLGMENGVFSPTIMRFGTIYGLSGRTRFDLVVNLLTAKAVKEKKITIFGGDQWRPFVHVDDAALAIAMLLESPLSLVGHQVFNVGSNEQNYRIQSIGRIINRILPSAELIHDGFDADRRNYRVSFDKLQTMLNFSPKWTLEKGVMQVVTALRNDALVDYRAAEYSNVKLLKGPCIESLPYHYDRWAKGMIDRSTTLGKAVSMVA